MSDTRLNFKSISHQSVGFNSLVYLFRALSTLRRSGLRTASAAAKPCQGDSSELYLITGSFDVFIDMDWLREYHAVNVCDEKIVRVPFKNETLIFQSKRNDQGYESRLNIISCIKEQKYLSKGCDVFLTHFTTKEAEDKLKGKRLEDVPIVRDFPEIFPEDLPGIPHARQVEFQINLVPGATHVARAIYRLV
nr:putative reverse transcriptase domain-containing protein [Tanacetum cinerariifolium]